MVVRGSRNRLSRHGTRVHRSTTVRQDGRRHQVIPALVVAVFVVFYLIPYSFYVVYFIRGDEVWTPRRHFMMEIIPCFCVLGLIFDTCIYIHLTKENRNNVLKLFRLCTRTNDENMGSVHDLSLPSCPPNPAAPATQPPPLPPLTIPSPPPAPPSPPPPPPASVPSPPPPPAPLTTHSTSLPAPLAQGLYKIFEIVI